MQLFLTVRLRASISIIVRHQKIPVSFHTAHPSIFILKFCHPSNSIQKSLLFPYNVEKGFKTIASAYQKHVMVSQKSSTREEKYKLQYYFSNEDTVSCS